MVYIKVLSSIKSLMQLKILQDIVLKILHHNLTTKVWGDCRIMLQIPHLQNVSSLLQVEYYIKVPSMINV